MVVVFVAGALFLEGDVLMNFDKDSVVLVNVHGNISIRLPEKKIREQMTEEEISTALRSLLPVVACVFRLNVADSSLIFNGKKKSSPALTFERKKRLGATELN